MVASDTRGPRFESSHRYTLYYLYTINCIEKTTTKKKRPRMAHFLTVTKRRETSTCTYTQEARSKEIDQER